MQWLDLFTQLLFLHPDSELLIEQYNKLFFQLAGKNMVIKNMY
jgi:hypothetical protein